MQNRHDLPTDTVNKNHSTSLQSIIYGCSAAFGVRAGFVNGMGFDHF